MAIIENIMKEIMKRTASNGWIARIPNMLYMLS